MDAPLSSVDKQGLTVDFLLSGHRDISAAKQLFTGAVERHGTPERITLDGYPATHSAVAELKKEGVLPSEMKIWTSKYLDDIIEQDHRRVNRAHLSDARLQEFC
jgi:transposase-like protein